MSANLATEAASTARRARTDAKIEDLEFLVDVGVSLEDALPRVGWTPSAAAQSLRRRGHPLGPAAHAAAARARREAA